MNRADLTALMQNLKTHGLESPIEKLLAVFLVFIDAEGMPFQQCDIFDALDINKAHGINTLKEFLSKGLIETFGRKTTFYRPTGLLSIPQGMPTIPQGMPTIPQGTPTIPQGTPTIPQGTPTIPQGMPTIPQGTPTIPRGMPSEPSPAYVNMLTLVNKTKLNITNKQGFEDSRISQAKDVTGSGGRKTADSRRQTAADASGHSTAAPPPSAAVCNLPSAVSPAQGTGTDADVRRTSVADSAFSAQSPTPLPPKAPRTPHVAVYDELLTNPDHTKAVLASNRKRIKNQDTADYIPGTVFCTDNPTDSLYHMLADLAWSKSLDPAYHLRSASEIIENLDKSPEFIEAEKSFTGYYNMLWALFCNVKNGRKTFDCMLHRAAYVFVIAGSDITIDFGPEFQSPQALVQACSRRYPEAPYTKLSGLLKDLFIGNGFGWHEYLIPNLEAWKREQKQYGKQARSELFKGYHYHKALMKKDGDKFLKQSGIEHQAAVSPADNTNQTFFNLSSRLEGGSLPPLPDARHPVLQAIDKASQGQLDRCLDGVTIKEEGGTAVLVCRNKFIADSLRRYEEIVKSAVKMSGFDSHAVRSADQPMTSILKPDNFIESSVEKNGTLRITTKPIPASLTDEAKKELTQRIRERVKEIETEHLQNWQQSRALAAVTD